MNAELEARNEKQDTPINFDSITAYLRRRFPERRLDINDVRSDLVGELLEVGFSTIQEVDAAINKGWGKFTADEQAQLDDPENGGVAVFYTASGAVRVAVGWVNPKLTELLRKKLDWSEEEDGVDESFPPS